MFAEYLAGFGFLYSVSYTWKHSQPTKKKIAAEKKWPKCHFLYLFFFGLRWPWVGEFVSFIMVTLCFPTQHNLVYYRKHPTQPLWGKYPTIVPLEGSAQPLCRWRGVPDHCDETNYPTIVRELINHCDETRTQPLWGKLPNHCVRTTQPLCRRGAPL